MISFLSLKVLYHCPGLREGVKKLYKLSKTTDRTKEESDKSEEVIENKYFRFLNSHCHLFLHVTIRWGSLLRPHCQQAEVVTDAPPPQIELLASFNSLVTSMEQLQSGFLLNPDSVSEELATPPRKVLNTLRWRAGRVGPSTDRCTNLHLSCCLVNQPLTNISDLPYDKTGLLINIYSI